MGFKRSTSKLESAVLLFKEAGPQKKRKKIRKKNPTIWQNKTTMAESDFQIGSITNVLGNSLCTVSGNNNGAVSTYAKGGFAPWP